MPTYIEGFEIDAVLNEERNSECEITEHPVEKGVSISDHARVKPKVISLDVVVSDTPVGALAERRSGLTTNADISPDGDFIASDVARAWLEALQLKRETVTVTTEWTRPDGSKGYKAFDNMMIQSISETITADSGDALTCKVTLKQVTYVTNDRTTVKVAVPRAKKGVDKGNKPNGEPTVPKRQVTGANAIYLHARGRGQNVEVGKGIGGFITKLGGS